MRIKAVFLDFGGTLAYGGIDWNEYHIAIGNLLSSLGHDVEMKKWKKAIGASIEDLWKYRSKGLERNLEEVYEDGLRRVGINADSETLILIHDTFKRYYRSTFFPCTEETLRKLAERYKLALISNTMSDQPREMLEETGLNSLFEIIICSRDLGIRKPNPDIFNHVLSELSVMSSETVHVGDSVEADMEGAVNSGITPIWIRTPKSYWSGHTISNICDLPSFLEKLQSV
jgi:HAD superfamily hydrolase (TIGR01549 family)